MGSRMTQLDLAVAPVMVVSVLMRMGVCALFFVLAAGVDDPMLWHPGLQVGAFVALIATEVVVSRLQSGSSVERCLPALPITPRGVALRQGARSLVSWSVVCGLVWFGLFSHDFAVSALEVIMLASAALIVWSAPTIDRTVLGDSKDLRAAATMERLVVVGVGGVSLIGVGLALDDLVGPFGLPLMVSGLSIGMLGWGSSPLKLSTLAWSPVGSARVSGLQALRPAPSPQIAAVLVASRDAVRMLLWFAVPLVVLDFSIEVSGSWSGAAPSAFWTFAVLFPALVGNTLYSRTARTHPISMATRGRVGLLVRLTVLFGVLVAAHLLRGAVFPAGLVGLVVVVVALDSLAIQPGLGWWSWTKSSPLVMRVSWLTTGVLLNAVLWCALEPGVSAAAARLGTDWHPGAAALHAQQASLDALTYLLPLAGVYVVAAAVVSAWRWSAGGARA